MLKKLSIFFLSVAIVFAGADSFANERGQKVKQVHEKYQKASPRQRDNFRDNMKENHPRAYDNIKDRYQDKQQGGDSRGGRFMEMRDKYKDATPEQRQQFRDNMQENHPRAYEKMGDIRSQLKDLPPEERQAKIQQLREEFRNKREERKAMFEDKWNSASPEQKNRFCKKASYECQSGKEFACKVAQSKCN